MPAWAERRAAWRVCALLSAGILCTGRASAETAGDWPIESFDLAATAFAPEQVHVRVLLPPGYDTRRHRYPTLYVNDGQDMAAVYLRETLAQLHGDHVIRPVIVVAIDMLHDRMGTYGLSDRAAARSLPGDSRFGQVGARGHDYSEWVAHTLVPYIDAHYRTETKPRARAVLGWSLGGLNAFNLGWQYPEVFGRVGAFSPSFWLAADRSTPATLQRTRLAQHMVDAAPSRPAVKFFFAVGGKEETSDRDGDGIIDAVDDTRDLVQGWQGNDGASLQGLAQRGYSVGMDWANTPARTDVAYVLLPDGEHNQASWARMLPLFLRWAYVVHEPPCKSTAAVTH
jgi:S-formylglutathione hydrolase FrmB